MTDYCNGSIEQVRACSSGKSPSLEEMLAMRRQSAGVSPLFALVEYVEKSTVWVKENADTFSQVCSQIEPSRLCVRGKEYQGNRTDRN